MRRNRNTLVQVISFDAGFQRTHFREETGKAGRHITCRGKPAKEVPAMTSVIQRFVGYPTILPVFVLVCGFARAQTDRVPKEGDRPP
jgi:hypothetical protein